MRKIISAILFISAVAYANLTPGNGVLPAQSGQGGKFLTTDGTAASWGTAGGSGVNSDLSNLTSPTAINQSLLFGTDATYDIGAAVASRPKRLYASDFLSAGHYPLSVGQTFATILNSAAPGLYFYNGGSDQYNVIASGASGVAIQNFGAGVDLLNVQNHLFRFMDTSAGAGIYYFQGAPSGIRAGTGFEIDTTTGALLISRMTAAEEAALTAVNGMMVYNTDTDAFDCYSAASWAACGGGGGGGATVALDNLASTRVNAVLNDSTGTIAADLNGRILANQNGFGVLDFTTNPALLDSTGTASLQFGATDRVTLRKNLLVFQNDGSTDVIKSDDANGGFFTGDSLQIATGLNNNTADPNPSGSLSLNTGDVTDAASTGATGNLSLFTGQNAGVNNSGDITIQSGNVEGVASPNRSGVIYLTTGGMDDATSTGPTGEIQIVTGNNSGAGASGDITIQNGDVSGGTKGSVRINSQSTVLKNNEPLAWRKADNSADIPVLFLDAFNRTTFGDGLGTNMVFNNSFLPASPLSFGIGVDGDEFSFIFVGAINVPGTITTGGTTGNQTINKSTGTVNFAAAATSIDITNSVVNANSIVLTDVRTADATCTVKNAVPTSGHVVITMTAACTAETSVGFLVVNQ